MNNKYDVIVVGAGPAGSTAARYAAQNGASVLLLEKDRDIGIPVRCAEGVSDIGIRTVVDTIDERWIENYINNVIFYPPSARQVELNFSQTGYILNRKLFDYDLAQMAVKAGAMVLTKAYVSGLLFEDDKVSGVTLSYMGKNYKIKAKIVIGADGVESRVGRWAGIKTRTALRDMETCAQVTVSNINLSDTHVHLFFSRRVAPEGYLWYFPKGDGRGNLGLGISGEAARHKSPVQYLDEFIADRFPGVSVLNSVLGGVPCDKTLETLVVDGLMLVGDAGHQVNPISGGGISTALLSGRIAGEVAGAAIHAGDVSAKAMKDYPKRWHKAEGKTHEMLYKLKNTIFNLTDEEFEAIADAGLKVPVEKRTMITLFRAALVKKPSLILDAIKIFS